LLSQDNLIAYTNLDTLSLLWSILFLSFVCNTNLPILIAAETDSQSRVFCPLIKDYCQTLLSFMTLKIPMSLLYHSDHTWRRSGARYSTSQTWKADRKEYLSFRKLHLFHL